MPGEFSSKECFSCINDYFWICQIWSIWNVRELPNAKWWHHTWLQINCWDIRKGAVSLSKRSAQLYINCVTQHNMKCTKKLVIYHYKCLLNVILWTVFLLLIILLSVTQLQLPSWIWLCLVTLLNVILDLVVMRSVKQLQLPIWMSLCCVILLTVILDLVVMLRSVPQSQLPSLM
jgi:hypothetical protein